MSTGSNIEWTDATWNPVSGCTRASEGCDNCYAVKQTYRLERMGQRRKYGGLTVLNKSGDRHFNGVVRCDEGALKTPLGWKKPRRVFVNSMSDLFHKDVPFDFIDRVFAVMALTPHLTFQILTKRPERMAQYLHGLSRRLDAWEEGAEHEEFLITQLHDAVDVNQGIQAACAKWLDTFNARNLGWPLPNVWLGTSVENQKAADERIPHLLRCPAAVRFLGCEPLLGAVDLRGKLVEWHRDGSSFFSPVPHSTPHRLLDWVIVGGESGHGARPMDLVWAQSLVSQCKAADVACFVKQLGAKPCSTDGSNLGIPRDVFCRDSKGGDPDEWPGDLVVRQFPATAVRV